MKLRIALSALALASVFPATSLSAQEATCNGKPATSSDLSGTDGDDVLIGTEESDVIYARRGNDTICGLGGNDHLSGFMGDDYIDGGAGDDRVFGCDPSHGKSDAIMCHTFGGNDQTDADALVGGDGDDHLFGHLSNDSLDGGQGYDVADGGEADDSCSAERYARCESMNPSESPPACLDGLDNDGDSYIDSGSDPECSGDRDPTEDVANDPTCFNGNDDDDDGLRDYPEDLGCDSFADTDELNCGLPCYRSISIAFDEEQRRYEGHIYETPERCSSDRVVRIKDRSGRTVGRAVSGPSGDWHVKLRRGRGYFAVARASTYQNQAGDTVRCGRLSSRRP